jgi:23S rRNA (uracil1939-C5)-methyltransferase
MSERLTITALGHEGDGIAETSAGRVFVPFTLPGETVEVERGEQPDRATLVEVIAPSADRIAPICRHFAVCGGCAMQHMASAPYLAWKREQVATALRQRGIDAEVEPVKPLAPRTRRRAIFSVNRKAEPTVLGFHRRGAAEIVPISECPVLVPALEKKLGRFGEMAAAIIERGKTGRLVAVAADNGIDVAVTGGRALGRRELEKLSAIALDPTIARLTVDGNVVFVNRRPEIASGGATLLPTPGGFLQAAAPAEDALGEAILAAIGKAAPIADLFAGIGTFTARLARKAQVTAVEGEAAAVSALEEALRKAKGLKPVTARRRDLFKNPLAGGELTPFGAVVFDPPAAGAKAQAAALAASSVKTVVAVSCNPATLARDARILIDGGYRLERVMPVDQFLFSAEIEAVAVFARPR